MDRQHSLGQTFTATHAGLNALQFDAAPIHISPDTRESLSLHLRTSPESDIDVAAAKAPLASLVDDPGFRFEFAAQGDSRGKSYFVLIETDAPPDTLSLWASSDDAVVEGALYQNGRITGRDLTLRIYEAPEVEEILLELGLHMDDLAWLIGLTLYIGLLGGGVLAMLGTGIENRWLLAPLVGAALLPIMLAILAILDVRLSAPIVIGAGLAFPLLAGLALLRARAWERLRPQPADLAIVGCFLLALILRVLQMRGVGAPLWVDGSVHATLVGNIVRFGRLQPDLPYHVGFHSLVALFHWLTGRGIPELILRTGQWLGAVGGLALYLLAKRLTKSHVAALATACVIWFLAPFPAYLVTWSRYPLLFGLALVPAAANESLPALKSGQKGPLVLAALLVAGMGLAHYGTISFWLTFVLTYWVASRKEEGGEAGLNRLLTWIVRAAALLVPLGVLAGIQVAPILLGPQLALTVASSRTVAAEIDPGYLFGLTLAHTGVWVWGAAIVGASVAWFLCRRVVLLCLGWFLAEGLLAAIQSPVLGEIIANRTNLLIALALPLALLVGVAGQWMAGEFESGGNVALRRRQAMATAWILAAALLGAREMVGIVNPATVLFTPADAEAMDWIKANTPAEGRWLVNSFFWAGSRFVPADGGGWIPAFTGREIVVPPDEAQAGQPIAFIQNQSLGYVYLGRAGGVLGRTPWTEADGFTLVYEKEGVRIYRRR